MTAAALVTDPCAGLALALSILSAGAVVIKLQVHR